MVGQIPRAMLGPEDEKAETPLPDIYRRACAGDWEGGLWEDFQCTRVPGLSS